MKKSNEMTLEEANAGLNKQFAEGYEREAKFIKQFREQFADSPILKKQETDIEKAIKSLEDDRCRVSIYFPEPEFEVPDINFHNMELETLLKEHITVNRTVRLFYTLMAGTDVTSVRKKIEKLGYSLDKYSFMSGLFQTQFIVNCKEKGRRKNAKT